MDIITVYVQSCMPPYIVVHKGAVHESNSVGVGGFLGPRAPSLWAGLVVVAIYANGFI